MFKFIKERFEEAKALYGVDLGNATRNFSRSISKLVTRYESFDDDFFEEFEETLISLDILPNLAILLRLELEKKILNKKVKSDTFQDNFITVLNEFVFTSENSNHEKLGKFPAIWLVVGVNGVGKTTTIAKLTHLQKAAGTSILLAAGDTFRAGAIEQLKIWSERLETPIVATHEGHDPAAVIYDASKVMKEKNYDLLIADTAGRLHNKDHLMQEMKKIHRTCKEQLPEHHLVNIMVIDGTIGKNSLDQARAFTELIGIDGIVVSKMDAKSKPGLIINLCYEFRMPIFFLGTGEQPDNLMKFDPELYETLLLESFNEKSK